ncbi:MAG: MFS transporter, partial [Gemmatimonadota bacterium]
AGLALYPLPATLWTAAVVFALVPIGTALLFPSVTALASHRADPKELGQTMGVQQSFGGVARVIAPLWATAAFQFLGPGSPFFIAAGIMAVVSLLAFQVPHAATRAEPAPAD